MVRQASLFSQLLQQVPRGAFDQLVRKHGAEKGAKGFTLRAEADERVLVTTLTKKMAENLTDYLDQMGVRVRYLHSDIETLERVSILRSLRLGEFDVLVGINLLREGLDIPEVSLVAILDADKEGFLRSEQALVQTIGRAARHVSGKVLFYADKMTNSMRRAIDETERRRELQQAHNSKHGIVPQSIQRTREEIIQTTSVLENVKGLGGEIVAETGPAYAGSEKAEKASEDRIEELEEEMRKAAGRLEFERAAQLRDQITQLRQG